MARAGNDRGAPKKALVTGDELTTIHSVRYSPSEGFKRLMTRNRKGAFRARIKAILVRCDSLLVQSELPRSGSKRIAYDTKGNWTDLESEPRTTMQGDLLAIASGAHFVKKNNVRVETFGREWYAAAIGELCNDVLASGASTPLSEQTLSKVFNIATLVADRYWRFRYKPSIRLGTLNAAATAAGGNATRGITAPRSKLVLEEMTRLRRNPRMSVANAAKIARANGFGKSGNANRALWYRANKKQK